MLSRVSLKSTHCVSALRSVFAVRARTFADSADVKKTALYDTHVQAGGKMVPFCGYSLPVQYTDGLNQSHAQVRTSAGLFDVSHMGQVTISGEHRESFMETLCVTDITGTKHGMAKLSVLTNEQGGVIDDCMITRKQDSLFVVLNAGCKEKDIAHIRSHIDKFNASHPSATPVALTEHTDRSLIAIQGPKAADVIQRLVPNIDLSQVAFMNTFTATIEGIAVGVTRCGYTGEDGFEISCADADAPKLWNVLAGFPEVLPAGLGVRDSLRLEAGLCLYGHELDEDISPIEAGLTWVISPRRRKEGGFLGAAHILPQLTAGVERKLVGLEVKAGAPARQGSLVLDKDGNQIGTVTSGGPSPSLNMKKIAIAMVKTPFTAVGTEIQVSTRGKATAAEVIKMPFITANYYRVPKPAAAAAPAQ
jgi:aminomethyltransferase